jgi:hypothetical protein
LLESRDCIRQLAIKSSVPSWLSLTVEEGPCVTPRPSRVKKTHPRLPDFICCGPFEELCEPWVRVMQAKLEFVAAQLICLLMPCLGEFRET